MMRAMIYFLTWMSLGGVFAGSVEADRLSESSKKERVTALMQKSHSLPQSLFSYMLFYTPAGKEWTLNKLAQRHKKMMLVMAWGSYCGPCKTLMPSLQTFAEKAKREVMVLPIALDGSSKEPPRIAGITMPLFYSPNLSDFMTEQGVEAIPSMFVFSPEGKLLNISVGPKAIRGILSTLERQISLRNKTLSD